MDRFRYGLLACAAVIGLTSMSLPASAAVRIERDEFGVPKITAETDAEMWFAFGFAQARDRLIQLEIMRQEAYGKLPEVDGVDVIGATNRKTRNWKRLHLFPNLKAKLQGELDALGVDGATTIRALTCFTQGIQAFKNVVFLRGPELRIEECSVGQQNLESLTISQTSDLKDLERAFIQKIFLKQKLDEGSDWEAVDSLALFHLRVMHEFSMRNTEMKNLKLLNDLLQTYSVEGGGDGEPPAVRAAKMFNSIKWSLHPNAKTTIPVTDEGQRAEPTEQAQQYHSDLIETTKAPESGLLRLNGCTIYNPDNFGGIVNQSSTLTAHNTESPFPLNASNWWIISQPGERDEGGLSRKPNSLLYNGPQISAIDPSHTYQIALTSEQGFRFAGNAYVGSPNFWQGHNSSMAFGLTAGNIDVSDVFCVPVKKNDDGKWSYKTGSGSLVIEPMLSGEALEDFKAVAREIDNRRLFGEELDNIFTVGTTGWPVLAIDKVSESEGTAYILRYNWQGMTASTIHHWLQATQAQNHRDWNTHLNGVAGNFNLSAAHQDGTIGYRLTGALPVRLGMNVDNPNPMQWNYYPGYDPRLPAPLPPSIGWSGEENNPIVTKKHKLQRTIESPRDRKAFPVQFIANWNQKPFINMPDGDLDYDSYTPYDRAFIIERLLKDHQGPWSQRDVQEMNGRLQRMDVNYIIFRPFLLELMATINDVPPQLQSALNLMLMWDGKRGDYRKGDVRGMHKGHVLFYYWLESLNDWFKNEIAGIADGEMLDGRSLKARLQRSLSSGQMKLKQPKLSWDSQADLRLKLSTETSHNIHLGSRIMLQALHAAFGEEISEKYGFKSYEYDRYQYKFIHGSAEAKDIMTGALKSSIAIAREQEWPIELSDKEYPYLPNDTATYSGLSNTLGQNDTQIGFRPEPPLEVKHFRNRGALNIVVGLWRHMVHGANVSSPGIREYRKAPGAGIPHRGLPEYMADWSVNQLYLFRDNEYRPMHDLIIRLDHPEDLRMGDDGIEPPTAAAAGGRRSPHQTRDQVDEKSGEQ